MKRLLSIIMTVVLLSFCMGCKSEDIRTPVNFYYCADPVHYNDPQGVISPELRDRSGYQDDLTGLLSLYLQGPLSEGYASPFPQNVQLEAISVADSVTEIQFSKEFSDLTGHKLTLACVCVTMTVMELVPAQAVRIQVADTQLDGSDYIEMTSHDLIFIDDYTAQPQS